MITALFPDIGTPITIKQGHTGNCYFLASLDCIFNSGPEGLAKIKSLFTETEHGVTVRIKLSDISEHLKVDKLKDKYDHFHDSDRNEDVFIISKERLNIIDGPSHGVKTNSLAVKILERLSSYYYVGDWGHEVDDMASVMAHNIPNRHKRTSTEFMGHLLGIETEELKDIVKVIKLKTIAPDYPVYISMSYGVMDAYGNTHGRHALRLDKIIPNPLMTGGYEFVLVNPWDNQKTESYSLEDIKARKYRFCFFNALSPKAQLTKLLLTLTVDEGQTILNTPPLLSLLLELQTLMPDFSKEDIERCYTLYQTMPNVGALFTHILPEEKQHFIEGMYTDIGSKELFLRSLLTKIPRIGFIQFLLGNEKLSPNNTLLLIDRCLGEKDKGLFNLLKDTDFLAKINSTILDKNLFIQNLIELSLEQEDVNFEALLNITKFIRQYNLTNLSPLTAEFTEKTIFNAILTRAINDKALLLGGDKDAAKQIVEIGLVQYYFNGDSSYINLSGSLRTLLLKPEFSKTLIEDISSPEWLVSGMAQFLKDPKISPALRKKLSIEQPLTLSQLNTILKDVEAESPRDGFFTLYEVSKINTNLAEMLHHRLIVQFDLKFNTPLSGFFEQIDLEEWSEFKQWFISAIPAEKKEQIRNELLLQTKAKTILEQSGFSRHLAVLLKKTIKLEDQKEKSEAYRLAGSKARELYIALNKAQTNFLTKPSKLTDKLTVFKKAADDAIIDALPVLEQHRGWSQVLLDIANLFILLGTGFTSYLVTQRFRLFTISTDSAEKVLALKENIQQITAEGA
jgi:hypothetical protein